MHPIILTVSSKQNRWYCFWRDRIIKYTSNGKYDIVNLSFDVNTKIKYSNMTWHGYMLYHAFKQLPSESTVLVVDNDAFPMSSRAIEITFNLEQEIGISGNIQRTGCIENNKHLFIGPSFLCLKASLVQNLGKKAWEVNNRSDTAEEIIWRNPHLDLQKSTFYPYKVLGKKKWYLDKEYKSFGRGTYYAYQGIPISYHNWESRFIIPKIMFFLLSMMEYYKIRYFNKN